MRAWEVPGIHVPIASLFLDVAVCGSQVIMQQAVRGAVQEESRLLRLLDPSDQGSLSTS